ncbi:MAG: protein kinase [Caldilineaceae bacterium]
MYDLYQGASIGPYPYHIIHRLGGGPSGMAEVYLANVHKEYQSKQGTPKVVLKIAATEKIETNNRSIRNEEEFLPRLDHAGIVRILPILSVDVSRGVLGYRARSMLPGEPWFCVFEYIPGYSCAEWVHRSRWRIRTHFAINLMSGIAEALQYLHERQIVHLDVKLSNILLRKAKFYQEITPVLIDFGICRKFGQRSSSGTAKYMAPERGTGSKEYIAEPSMDAYSLGIVMQELLNLTSPSTQMDLVKPANTLLAQDANQTVRNVLHEIVFSMLDNDPQRRPDIATILVRLGALKERLKFYHRLWRA